MINTDLLKDTTADALKKSIKEAADFKYALVESCIVAITDQKGTITYANDNFCKISKYSREELIGKDHRIINSGFHSKEFIKNLWTTIANGKIWRGELKNKAKDGTYYWVDTTIVPFLNSEGKPYQYVASRADITSRKETEEHLEKSLKEVSDYKYAIEESSIVAITDQKGIIKYVNDNFCKISKYDRSELIGQDHCIINSKYHPKEFIRNLWVTIAKGKIWRGELKNKAKDGTYYWVDTTIVPFLDEHGKPYQYVAIRADITARKETEEHLEKSLKEVSDYKYAIEESSIVAITDQKGIIKYVNDNFCKISKYDRDELIGQDHRIINSKYHPKEFIRNLWVTIAKGKIWRGELKNKAKDGTYYWVDTTIVPFLGDDNKPYQYIAIRADITARKEAEEHLEKSLKEVSDYKYAIEESSIVAITDQKGIIKYVNDNFCKISKYDRDELIGQDHRIINSKYHPKEFIRNLWVTIANGKIWRGELKNKAKDGTHYWVDTTIVPFLDAGNKPYQYIAIRADITARKETEEHLEKSLKEVSDYKYAIEESSIVAITDQKGIIKYVNDNFCKISKYDRDELIGQDHRIINSKYHPKEFIRNLWVTIANGKIWRGELKNKAKDGTYYWVDTTIVPFLDEYGKPYQYVAIRADITTRKETEEILIKSQKETSDYKYALDAGAIVSIVDHNGMTIYVNDNFCKISQFSSQELIGQNLRPVYANFLGQEFMDNIWATITGGEIWRGEVKNEAKDGTIYWTHVTTVPFLDEYGKPYQFLSIRTDITERKKGEILMMANKELSFQNEMKEKRAAELIITNKELAFQNGEKGKRAAELVVANKELAFQNAEKEKRAKELIVANVELAFQSEEKEKRATELIIANKELAFQIEEKEKKAEELSIANWELKKAEDDIRKLNKEDIRKLNEELEQKVVARTAQLETANQELESFSYSVSHDLRTPLRAVNGYAKMLEDNYADLFDSEGKRMLAVVQNNAKKMGVLIDDLLAFSRLGRKEIKKSVINMTALVENVLAELHTSQQFKEIVKINDLHPATADITLMNQVWENLLSNAIKYSSTNKEPAIKIGSERKNDELIYSISDNGVGFDMKYVHKLFGVFQRLHSSKDFEGTGVGLALVHRIITKQGGKIWATAEINKGATFYFSLPEKQQTK